MVLSVISHRVENGNLVREILLKSKTAPATVGEKVSVKTTGFIYLGRNG